MLHWGRFMQKNTHILSAATIIMIMALASRVLGLVRERLLITHFGVSVEHDVYKAAFLIPDTIFELLVFGAISVSFIPVFTHMLEDRDKGRAFRLASSVINIAFLLFCLIGLIVFFAAPLLADIIIPGIVREHPESRMLLANLVRLMLVAQAFFVLSGFLTAMLHSFQRFFIPAVAAVVYNVSIIASLILLTPAFGIYAPALGVVLGAFVHLLVQVPLVKKIGFQYEQRIDTSDPGIWEIGRLMAPRTVGLAVSRINDVVNAALASFIAIGSITSFNVAYILQLVPIGLFGAAIAQAALPTLAATFAKKKLEEFKATILSSFHQILFLVMPASAILIALRIPMTRLFFGAKTFTWDATVLTGKTLSFFGISLFAQACALLLARSFYAMHDSKTPVKATILSVILNIFLSTMFIFVFNLEVWSLALAYSIASILNAALLLVWLDKRVGGFDHRRLTVPTVKIATAAVVMALGLRIVMKQLDVVVFDTTRTMNLILLTASVTSIGMALYLTTAWFLRVEELGVFVQLFSKIAGWPRKLDVRGWRKTLWATEEVIEGTTHTPTST